MDTIRFGAGHSRRDFMRNLAIFGIGTAGLPGLSGMALAQGTPTPGGVMSLVTSGDPPNFDPFSNTTSYVLHIVAACYNSLLMMDPENPDKIIGDLATGWTQSDDGLSYTFTLVNNAKFHDGKPLTSADVKYTFDIVRDPPEGVVSARKSLLSAISSIDAVDDYTVRFNLSRPSPGLLASLATGWFIVAPKHILEVKGTMADDVIGSGPFRFKEYISGVSYEMERNPDYHVPDRPFLDGLKYYIVPDESTRFAYLRTGQIDLYDGLTGKDARTAEAEFPDTVKVYSTTSYVGDPFTMNAARTPFDDIRVRKAIAYSINHDEALKVLMDGDGVVGGLLIPGPWSISAEELAAIPGYGKDVEANRAEARKLLAEAGFPDGFETTLTARKAAGTHEAARPVPRGPVLQDRGQGNRQGAGKRGLFRDDEEPRFRHGDQRHLGVEQRPGLHDRRLPHLRRRTELFERLRPRDRRSFPASVGRNRPGQAGGAVPRSGAGGPQCLRDRGPLLQGQVRRDLEPGQRIRHAPGA